MTKEEMFEKLSQAVVDMEDDEVVDLANQCIDEGIDAFEAIDKGLSAGMEEAGKLFEEEEYFVPELLMCADAMNAGIDVLKPHLASVDDSSDEPTVVIGVIEGDTHDIGKNLVKLMMETSGFNVIDVGRDATPEQFIDKAEETGAKIICISTLMTTTMDTVGDVVKKLEERGIRDKYKIMVGGGPVSASFVKKIGADGYSRNAADAVKLAKKICNIA
ncbi:MAG: corrinoid protein [Lachnospiraceae bacterium]|nr:corrinoid protein [Lachnospiraceae bacterium]